MRKYLLILLTWKRFYFRRTQQKTREEELPVLYPHCQRSCSPGSSYSRDKALSSLPEQPFWSLQLWSFLCSQSGGNKRKWLLWGFQTWEILLSFIVYILRKSEHGVTQKPSQQSTLSLLLWPPGWIPGEFLLPDLISITQQSSRCCWRIPIPCWALGTPFHCP